MNQSTGRHVPPLGDYDELPRRELQDRMCRLNRDEINRLLAHEHEHGGRVDVLAVLASRRDQLAQRADQPVSPPAPPRQ